MAAALRSEIPGIVNSSRISDEGQNLLFGMADKSFYAVGRYTDPSLFGMFTLPFLQGNPKSAFEELHSIVLTEKTVKKFFGEDKNVIGRTVRIDNKQDYTVTGVLKDLPENSTLQFEWLAPFDIEVQRQKDRGADWNSYGPLTYVELDANADPAAVNEQLKDFIHRKEPGQKSQALLFPMKRLAPIR